MHNGLIHSYCGPIRYTILAETLISLANMLHNIGRDANIGQPILAEMQILLANMLHNIGRDANIVGNMLRNIS
jgi:hypothetical protein